MEKLYDSRRLISELWDRQPPENRLQILVEIPAEGGPPTGTSRWIFLVLYLSDAFMAYEHSNPGQIPPHICLDLLCLLVKNDGTPVGNPKANPKIALFHNLRKASKATDPT
jgi:hypothetical protein